MKFLLILLIALTSGCSTIQKAQNEGPYTVELYMFGFSAGKWITNEVWENNGSYSFIDKKTGKEFKLSGDVKVTKIK